MNIFPQNYCRICSSFFCCQKCRLNHEKSDHNVHPECDICIYGKALLRKPSSTLLRHLTETHLPLHCLYCEKVFRSSEELIQHSTCTTHQKPCNRIQENSDMFVTPISATDSNYDSPPITAIMHKSILASSNKYLGNHNNTVWLTTSTPLHKLNEREMMENIPEVITPVDHCEHSVKLKSVNTAKSGETPVIFEQSKNTEQPLKRRVTFCETPIISIHDSDYDKRTNSGASYEMHSTSNGKQFSKSSEFATNENMVSNFHNSCNQNENYSRNKSDSEFDVYMTPDVKAKDVNSAYSIDAKEISDNQRNQIAAIDCAQLYHVANNDTMWESALMDQNLTQSEISSAMNYSSVLSENIKRSPKAALDLSTLETSSAIDQFSKENSVLSPLLHQNLNKSQMLSPIIKLDEMKLEIFHPDQSILKEEPSVSMCDQYSTISQKSENYDVSNIENGSLIAPDSSEIVDITHYSQTVPSKQGLWSSMANMVKTMVQGLSGSSTALDDSTKYEKKECGYSHKRPKPENDDISVDENPVKKRMKLTDIRCRRTIRNIGPLQHIKYSKKKVKCVDKWTQTD